MQGGGGGGGEKGQVWLPGVGCELRGCVQGWRGPSGRSGRRGADAICTLDPVPSVRLPCDVHPCTTSICPSPTGTCDMPCDITGLSGHGPSSKLLP
jgi:hypothetical protein